MKNDFSKQEYIDKFEVSLKKAIIKEFHCSEEEIKSLKFKNERQLKKIIKSLPQNYDFKEDELLFLTYAKNYKDLVERFKGYANNRIEMHEWFHSHMKWSVRAVLASIILPFILLILGLGGIAVTICPTIFFTALGIAALNFLIYMYYLFRK